MGASNFVILPWLKSSKPQMKFAMIVKALHSLPVNFMNLRKRLIPRLGPEVSFCLKDGYLPRPNDIWAIGICIYTYLTEELPFNGESDIEVQIATKDKDFKIFDWMGEDLQDLLRGLLDKDPTKRYTIEEVKAHKWFIF